MVNRTLLFGAGGLLGAAAVAAVVVTYHPGRERMPSPKAAAGSSTAATAPASTAASTGPDGAAPQRAAPASAAAAAAPAPASEAPVPPSFDVVRVDPQGSAVIAGRAAPNAEVSVLDGDRLVGRVTADARGEWVILPAEALPPGNRTLRLSEKLPGKGEAVASAGDVLLAVPQPRRDVAGQSAPGPSGALALLVPHAGDAVARPLQVPQGQAAASGKSGAVSLDIIEYDSEGRLALAGRADPDRALDIYLGDKLIAEARAGSDGAWSAKPKDPIPSGPQQLRIDELGGAGKVVARLAIPFRRAETANLARGEFFTVMPGNNLWRIARRSYGSGLRYAIIYAANRDLIADPNRIYPGQVFKLPPG